MEPHEYQINYELEKNYWWFRGMRRCLDVFMPKNTLGSFLDVGCGTGMNLVHWGAFAQTSTGVDSSATALEFCRKRGIVNLTQADACALPFGANEFDTLTAIGIIEHIDTDQKFLEECFRVLRPGGQLILLTSAFSFLWSEHDLANHHKRRYSKKEIIHKTRSAGLELKKISYVNFFLFPIIAPLLISHRLLSSEKKLKKNRFLPVLPKSVNFLLTQIIFLEAKLLGFINFPWGVSLIGSFRKPGT